MPNDHQRYERISIVQALFDLKIPRITNCKTHSSSPQHFNLVANSGPNTSSVLQTKEELMKEVRNPMFTAQQSDIANKLVNEEFTDIFAKTNKPSQARNVAHHIVTGDANPISHPPCRTSPK